MDETSDTNNNTLGAPELSPSVKPPSAPLVEDRQKGPIFKAAPEPVETAVPIETSASSVFDDEDDDIPEAPPALDEHQARIEYLQSINQRTKKKKSGFQPGRAAVAIVLIFIIVGAIGTAVYFWFHNARPNSPAKKPTPAVAQTQPTQTEQTPATTTDPTATTSEPKTYSSTVFNLSLSYPGDWTAPDEQASKLTITSPVVTLTNASNQTASGRMVLTIRPRQDKPAEFAAGKVVAVLASDKINYTAPAAAQRKSTYISYLQYAGTKVKGGMDGLYITGSYGYKYAQVVQLSEISKVDPLVEISFVSCSDVACATATQKPLTVSSTAWKADTTNRPAVETLLKSIVFN
jgi:cytoskeletal protein RodZ